MSLHVEVAGVGPPLVLLHGWAMHSGFWTPIMPRLVERFRVHAVDLPGHGWSAPLEPFTLDALVDALDAWFAGADGLSVLGWSLGGLVALEWARRAGAPLRRLVLTSTTPRFLQAPDWPQGMERVTLERFKDELAVSYRRTLERFVHLQIRGSRDETRILALMRRELQQRNPPSPATLERGLLLLATTDLRQRLSGIELPVLVIAGDRDALTPAAAGAWLAGALSQGRFERIDGAAHAPFLSHADHFADLVTAFAS